MKTAKDVWCTFRCTPAWLADIKAKARQLDFPHGHGQLMRTLGDGVLRHGEAFLRGGGGLLAPLDRQAVKRLADQTRLTGNLLNQIVRRLNIYEKTGDGPPPAAAEVHRVLADIAATVDAAHRLLAQHVPAAPPGIPNPALSSPAMSGPALAAPDQAGARASQASASAQARTGHETDR